MLTPTCLSPYSGLNRRPATTFNAWDVAVAGAAANQPLAAGIRFAQAVAQGSRATSTLDRYKGHWARWVAWCEKHTVTPIPAQPAHVAAYLGSMLRWCVEHSKSFAPIKMASACIHTAHELAGLSGQVTAHPMVASVRSAAERILGRAPSNTKQPLPKQLCIAAALQCEACGNLLAASFMLICFAGFLRYSDAARIPAFKSGVQLFLPCRKNDQCKFGTVVTITAAAVGAAAACPVRMLLKYLHRSPPPDMHAPLFRAPGTPCAWPYKDARDAVLGAVASSSGFTTSIIQRIFGTHSLRKGGATEAANKLPGDVHTVALFLAHGGWRSKQAAAIYAKPSIRVAKAVGL